MLGAPDDYMEYRKYTFFVGGKMVPAVEMSPLPNTFVSLPCVFRTWSARDHVRSFDTC